MINVPKGLAPHEVDLYISAFKFCEKLIREQNTVDGKEIVAEVVKLNAARRNSSTLPISVSNPTIDTDTPEDDGVESPDEIKEWRVRLTDILQNCLLYTSDAADE